MEDITFLPNVDEITPAPGWEIRHDELEDALDDLGLSMRTDSRLCARYVVEGVGDARSVATVMEEMDFFWKKTAYRRALRVIEYEHWPEEIDDDALSAMAKRRALRWLVRNGDEDTLDVAPPSLEREIWVARRAVYRRASVTNA